MGGKVINDTMGLYKKVGKVIGGGGKGRLWQMPWSTFQGRWGYSRCQGSPFKGGGAIADPTGLLSRKAGL